MKTTAIYPNRQKDKELIEKTMGLPEFPGDDVYHFSTKRKTHIADSYVRIVYGDHGPYVEFHRDQIVADMVNKFDTETPPNAFYTWLTIADGSGIKIYDQHRPVTHLKNPPKGGFQGNRAEGYADYKPGMIYISPSDMVITKTVSMEIGEYEASLFENRVIVAGSRNFNDYVLFLIELLADVEAHNYNRKNTVFITGDAPSGPDRMIIDFCKQNLWHYHRVPAKWDELDRDDNRVVIKTGKGKKPYNALAGMIRNEKMSYLGNRLIAMWDGLSKGTKNMIELAQKRGGYRIHVVLVDPITEENVSTFFSSTAKQAGVSNGKENTQD